MPDISYVILVPEEDGITPFQGFNLSATGSSFLRLLKTTCLLPNDTAEIFMNQETFLTKRKADSGKAIIAVGVQHVDRSIFERFSGLIVVVAAKEQLEKAHQITQGIDRPFTILSNVSQIDVIDHWASGEPNHTLLDQNILEHLKRVFVIKTNGRN